MTTTTAISDIDRPLSPAQNEQLAAAQARAAKVRRAAAVAGFNGWATGILAACSAPFALFSLSGLVVTCVLALVAYNEFRGRCRLLQFDDHAPAFLGWNQVGLLATIILYCFWMLFVGLTGEGPFATELAAQPELAQVLGSADELDGVYRLVLVAVYTTTIVLSIVFQGLNAAYYFTRSKLMNDYLSSTPSWVLDLQRITSPT